MNSKTVNLFLVDDNKRALLDLKHSLTQRFGSLLNISTFKNGENAVQSVNQDTSIVVLNNNLNDENVGNLMRAIKKTNPATEIIMLSSSEDLMNAIESFRNRVTDYLLKSSTTRQKVNTHIQNKIVGPLRKIGQEYGLKKLIVIFLSIFATMGTLVFFLFKAIN